VGAKAGSAVRDLGCTIPELMVYLEARFQEGMSWENYGAWHLDHIKPLVLFDLTDREQFLQAAHYTNLQPLWAATTSASMPSTRRGVNTFLVVEVEGASRLGLHGSEASESSPRHERFNKHGRVSAS
jgi:hypothetical protein